MISISRARSLVRIWSRSAGLMTIIRQGVVEIVVGQMALLRGKAHEVFDLRGEVQPCLAGDQAKGLLIISQ